MRASKLGRYSWTMFDWANQPFYTLIMTFVFSVYFTDVFITGEDGAQKLTLTQTISGLAIALLSPVLGSITANWQIGDAKQRGEYTPYRLLKRLLTQKKVSTC